MGCSCGGENGQGASIAASVDLDVEPSHGWILVATARIPHPSARDCARIESRSKCRDAQHRQRELARELVPATTTRSVGVVGGGPGGIMAAVTSSKRGHKVTLYDARERLGGWLIAGAVPKTKYEVANYLTYLEGQVRGCGREHALRVELNATVTAESLKKEKFDVLVICSGALPLRPDVEGIQLPHVVQGVDLFLHPEWAKEARDIVVVGGGAVACEAAHWLTSEYGKRVSLVEKLAHFMPDVCTANLGHLIHDLEKRGARLFNCSSLISVRSGEVTIARNISSTVPDPYITWTPLLPENIPNPLAKPIREEVVEQTRPIWSCWQQVFGQITFSSKTARPSMQPRRFSLLATIFDSATSSKRWKPGSASADLSRHRN